MTGQTVVVVYVVMVSVVTPVEMGGCGGFEELTPVETGGYVWSELFDELGTTEEWPVPDGFVEDEEE